MPEPREEREAGEQEQDGDRVPAVGGALDEAGEQGEHGGAEEGGAGDVEIRG